MPVDIVPSSLSVAATPEVSYGITLVNNLLESVQAYDYPNNWQHDKLEKNFHGMVLLDPLFVSHDKGYKMWEEGKPASKGIGKASMFGLPSSESPKLIRDLEKAGSSVKSVVQGGSLVAAPEDADGDSFFSDPSEVVQDPVAVDVDHLLLSSFIRIEPSPCWFTGFHDFMPVSNDGMWLESFTVPVFPYTSDWATGTEYLDQSSRMAKAAEDKGVITQFDLDTLPQNSKVFLNEEKTEVPPVAQIKFSLQQRETKAEEPGAEHAGVIAVKSEEEGSTVEVKNTSTSFWSNGWTIAGLCVIGIGVVGAISLAAVKMSKKAKYTQVPEGERQTLIV